MKLSVPFTGSGQVHRFADKFPAMPNLTGGTVIVRLYAPDAVGLVIYLYANDTDYSAAHNGVYVESAELSAGWVDASVPIGSAIGTFDPIGVSQVSIELNSLGAGPWTTPAVVYVDGVRSADGAINHKFDTSIETMVTSSQIVVGGSTMTWQAVVP